MICPGGRRRTSRGDKMTTAALRAEFAAHFSCAELLELESCSYPLPDRALTTLDLIMAWARHVRKIDADRVKSGDDRDVWVAHDLVAAMFLRDFLENCLQRLSPTLAGKSLGEVKKIDDQFLLMTQDDEDGLVERVAGETLTGKPWWWNRIPNFGPLLEDLLAYREEE